MQSRGEFLESERRALLPRLIPPLVHKLNNTLAVFAGACDGLDNGPAERTIRLELDHMGATLRHLARFSSSRASEPELVDLCLAIEGMRRVLAPFAASLGVTIRYALPTAALLRADPFRLEQLLVAFVGEQLLALGGESDGENDRSSTARAEIRISVRDHGRGENARLTFALARRALPVDDAPSAVVRAAAASGELGLRVSLRTMGAATRICFGFACESIAREDPSARHAVEASRALANRSRKLLLIEQDESLSGLIADVLAEAGYTVTTGLELPSLESLVQSSDDIILLDAGADWLEPGSLHAIATHEAVHPRLILLGTARDLRACDAAHVLPKPFRPHELLEAVRQRLAPSATVLAT